MEKEREGEEAKEARGAERERERGEGEKGRGIRVERRTRVKRGNTERGVRRDFTDVGGRGKEREVGE